MVLLPLQLHLWHRGPNSGRGQPPRGQTFPELFPAKGFPLTPQCVALIIRSLLWWCAVFRYAHVCRLRDNILSIVRFLYF